MKRVLTAALVTACSAAPPEGSTTVRVRVTMQDTPGPGVVIAQATPPPPTRSPTPRAVVVAAPRREAPAPTPPGVCGASADASLRTPSIDELALGHGHTCARLTDGTVRCWGENLDGQVGDGHTGSDRGPAAPAQVPDVERVAQVCAGFAYTCARYLGGRAECWGNNTHNQINFSLHGSCTPHPVRSPVDHVRALACGAWHVCAIRDDGSAWCWGEDAPRYSPWRVRLPGRVEALAAGARRTCARTVDGRVFCWTVTARDPVEVTGFTARPTQLTAAEHFACAALADGTAACWGDGYHGELGNGAPLESRTPVVVPGLSRVRSTHAAEGRACARTEGGELWCWGVDPESSRGRHDDPPRIMAPTRFESIAPIQSVSLGVRHACALTETNTLCCWGNNFYGQLGNNTTSSPERVNEPVAVTW